MAPTAPASRRRSRFLRTAKVRGAVLAGALYAVAASPFFLDILSLSIHEDNLYSTVFVLLNGGWLALWLSLGAPHMSNLTGLVLFGVGWAALGFLIGAVVDFRRR
jgi:hypothetical protein